MHRTYDEGSRINNHAGEKEPNVRPRPGTLGAALRGAC